VGARAGYRSNLLQEAGKIFSLYPWRECYVFNWLSFKILLFRLIKKPFEIADTDNRELNSFIASSYFSCGRPGGLSLQSFAGGRQKDFRSIPCA
jgi:hypothetical protein